MDQTNQPDEKSTQQLLAYVNALLDDPEHAELDVSLLPEGQRELGERLNFLGGCVQEGRAFAEDLGRGNLGTITSTYSAGDNPLIPSLDSVRQSLAQLLSLGQQFSETGESVRLEPKSDYAVALNSMLDEVRRQHDELERSAYTDSLTGAGNRRAYDRTIDELWAAGTPFSIAFVDIDHLKGVNDRFGHSAGNRCITQTALYLRLRRRAGEGLFRIGGDEFVFVSPTETESGLAARLGQCREQLMATSHQNEVTTFSFSFGCSSADPAAGDDRRQMVTDADKKMYRYKLTHRPDATNGGAKPQPTGGIGLDERIFEALAMTSEGRYYFVCDIDHDESIWSVNAVRDFGLPSSHMHQAGALWTQHIHPDDRAAYVDEISRLFRGEIYRHSMQYRARDARGEYVICECRGYRLDAEGTKPALFVGTITNRSIAESIDPATGLGDIHGLVIAIGSARHLQRPTGLVAVKFNGLSQVNATHGYETGDNLLAAVAERIVTASRGKMTAFRSRGAQFALVGTNMTSEDTWRVSLSVRRALELPIEVGDLSFTPDVDVAWLHYDEVSTQPFAVLSDLGRRLRSVTEQDGTPAASRSELVNALTGLRGGTSFLGRASEANLHATGSLRCLVSIDLGNMRLYNEWFGHEEGDALLADVGRVLSHVEEEGSAIAGYWGQDDFCLYTRFDRVLIDDIYGRVRQAVAAHSDSPGFSPSFGVFPLDCRRKVTIDDYSKALFTNRNGKHDFKNRISFFEPLRYEEKSQEHQLLSSFQYAISDGEIFFVLQPQCDLATGKVVGAEALVRWTKKNGEKLTPAQVVPVLEKNGFIVTLDKHIWGLVAQWMAGCVSRGIAPVPVSINVSRVDILAFDVPEFIRSLLTTWHLSPALLEVEITETAYMQDQQAVSDVVNRLRSMGVRVLMDDFGTGSSSLSMLGGVNVDVIKLDRQFLPNVENTQLRIDKDESIVASMVLMARSLDLPMIVEGVETQAQAELITSLGARYVQGFHCYRPMPAQSFERLLADPAAIDYGGILKPSERGVDVTPPRAISPSGEE